MAVRIDTKTENGSAVEVHLEKTAGTTDKGTIRLRSKKSEADAKPHREESYQLYNISTNKDGSVTTCRADVPGSDPVVTISLNAKKDQPSITIDIKGTSFKIGDGTTTYEVTEEAQEKIRSFLVESFSG